MDEVSSGVNTDVGQLLAEEIRRGVAEAEAGSTVDLGDFTQFLRDMPK
ncbi:hypothetical protein [Nocardia sp. XZ_19_369]|nr:hypothetical protein [Nocardia sp. XZ_19_369]